jgi:cation diffusion facilitator family transporter
MMRAISGDSDLDTLVPSPHGHVFLGANQAAAERRTWAVIALCGAMMVLEIAGGLLFGSLALVADGLHMSTHAGALLLAALAYWYARRHADDARFSFGTGKLGDLAGFASAIVLAMIALLIGYEAAARLLAPVPIRFGEAIPIAVLGLLVNVASVFLLNGGGHDHHHGHHHGHGHGHDHDEDSDHDHDDDGHGHEHGHVHASAHRDNNMRAAIVHVMADAAVSIMVIAGLLLAKNFGWLWMDPVAGLIGAVVIASWSVGLIRDTGAILLDMTPDSRFADRLRGVIEAEGDTVADLHVWRLGPGHLGAIVSVRTNSERCSADYHARLAELPALSHLTVEVCRA